MCSQNTGQHLRQSEVPEETVMNTKKYLDGLLLRKMILNSSRLSSCLKIFLHLLIKGWEAPRALILLFASIFLANSK
jgi:hypothetical protein